ALLLGSAGGAIVHRPARIPRSGRSAGLLDGRPRAPEGRLNARISIIAPRLHNHVRYGHLAKRAVEISPGRKPWVSPKKKRAPSGAARLAKILDLWRPFQGLTLSTDMNQRLRSWSVLLQC